MPTHEESEALRHWRDRVRFSRGDHAARRGIEYLTARMAEGWVFQPEDADLVGNMAGYAEFGLASSLRRFWPRLLELVAGNETMARRMAELREQVHIVELDLDGFAAGVRRFPDGSCLIQIDTGMLLTVFVVVQMFVAVSMPGPSTPDGQAEREAAVVLELLLAEYRLLRRDATPKGTLPTAAQGAAIGELTQAANVFALAHEVSHLLLSHVSDRGHDQRQRDEISSDVLALRILSGAYASGPLINRSQAYGRLLGVRLLFSCIELFERATFVTAGRTHPPAADRWDVVRMAAGQLFGPLIPDGVDELWRPMDRLLTATGVPTAELRQTLESMRTRRRFIGEAVDVASAIHLIELFRLTNATADDPALRAEGAALAAAARIEAADRGAISWRDLFDLQLRRRGLPADECVLTVAAAARILLRR